MIFVDKIYRRQTVLPENEHWLIMGHIINSAATTAASSIVCVFDKQAELMV